MVTHSFVHLQAVGDVPGKPASELQPGDWVGYNFGYADEVATVEKASACFVLVTFTSGYDQKFKRNRLVAMASAKWRHTEKKR